MAGPAEDQDGRKAAEVSAERGHPTDEREHRGSVPCPVCGFPIGAVRGSKAAICRNCGFKDGCC